MSWISGSAGQEDIQRYVQQKLQSGNKGSISGLDNDLAMQHCASARVYRPSEGITQMNMEMDHDMQRKQAKAASKYDTSKDIVFLKIRPDGNDTNWAHATTVGNYSFFQSFTDPPEQLRLSPVEFFPYFSPTTPDGNSYDVRELLGRGMQYQWDEEGKVNRWFSMGVFPTVLIEDSVTFVRPYGVYYASFEPNPFMMLHMPQWEYVPMQNKPGASDDRAIRRGLYIDMALIGDADSMKSIMSAINLCNPRPSSYVWVAPLDYESSRLSYDLIAAQNMVVPRDWIKMYEKDIPNVVTRMGEDRTRNHWWDRLADRANPLKVKEFLDQYIKDVCQREGVENVHHLIRGYLTDPTQRDSDGQPKMGILRIILELGAYYQIGGASLGLATIACFLNLPRMAYTGFVRRLGQDHVSVRELRGSKKNFDERELNRPRGTFNPIQNQVRDMRNDNYGTTRDANLGDLDSHKDFYALIRKSADPKVFSDLGVPNTQYAKIRPWKKFSSSKIREELVRVAKGNELVENVDMLQFKAAWSIKTGWPLMIPYSSDANTPLYEVLKKDVFRTNNYMIRLLPNAYSMVQFEQGIQYQDVRTPILICATVSAAIILSVTVYLSEVNINTNDNNPFTVTYNDDHTKYLKEDLTAMYQDITRAGQHLSPEQVDRNVNRQLTMRSKYHTVRNKEKGEDEIRYKPDGITPATGRAPKSVRKPHRHTRESSARREPSEGRATRGRRMPSARQESEEAQDDLHIYHNITDSEPPSRQRTPRDRSPDAQRPEGGMGYELPEDTSHIQPYNRKKFLKIKKKLQDGGDVSEEEKKLYRDWVQAFQDEQQHGVPEEDTFRRDQNLNDIELEYYNQLKSQSWLNDQEKHDYDALHKRWKKHHRGNRPEVEKALDVGQIAKNRPLTKRETARLDALEASDILRLSNNEYDELNILRDRRNLYGQYKPDPKPEWHYYEPPDPFYADEIKDTEALGKRWQKDKRKPGQQAPRGPYSAASYNDEDKPKRKKQRRSVSIPDIYATRTTIGPTEVGKLYKMHRSVSQARTDEESSSIAPKRKTRGKKKK